MRTWRSIVPPIGSTVTLRVQNALKLNPASQEARQRSDLIDQILALDPTLRGLAAAERYRRSRLILAGAVERLESCGDGGTSAQTGEAIKLAKTLVASRKRPRSYRDAAESNTALAERLWNAAVESCGANLAAGDPLGRVMMRLTRR